MSEQWTAKNLKNGKVAVFGTVYADRSLFEPMGGVWSTIKTADATINAWTVNPTSPLATHFAATVEKHNANLTMVAPTALKAQPARRPARHNPFGLDMCSDCQDGRCCGNCPCCEVDDATAAAIRDDILAVAEQAWNN